MVIVVPLVAFAVSLLGTPLAAWLGRRLGFLDRPGELSIHQRPVPRTGGLALLAGLGAALVVAWIAGLLAAGSGAGGPPLLRLVPLVRFPTPLLGLLAGAAVVAGAGLLDDARQISPLHKLLWLFVGAAIAVGLGVQFRTIPVTGLALGLTLFFLVGSSNAMNLLDGMDGLACGLAAIAGLALAGLGWLAGQPLVWVPALALAGACLGFLPHNYPRARIFMGDGGSLFLGFALAGLVALLAQGPYDWPGLLAPVLVLAVPLTDTALAMVRRFGRQQDLFSGDREHIYDLLSRKGLGDTRAVLAMYALGAAVAGLALVVARLPAAAAALVAALAVGGLVALAGRLGALGKRRSVSAARFRLAVRGLVRRYSLAFALDGAIVAGSYYLALFLRLSPDIPRDAAVLPHYVARLAEILVFVVFIYLLANGFFGLYGRVWRHARAEEARLILAAGTVGTAAVLLADILMGATRPVPVSVVIVGGMMSTMGFAASRYRFRLLTGFLWRAGINVGGERPRTLIVGAGEAGQLLAWRMLHLRAGNGGQGAGANAHNSGYLPVGFVDDDPDKRGMRVHGLKVLGDRHRIPELVEELSVDLVVVAIHSLEGHDLDEIVELCLESEAKVKLLPNVLDGLLDDRQGLGGLREVQIDDLLGRPVAGVDGEACRGVLQDKRVLVTGAAGSIGAEICRQALACEPARLLALDQNETGLYDLALELEDGVEILMADIRDKQRMEALFAEHQPEIVYHAAAYKHVPLLELCPSEAFTTNVVATQTLIDAARSHGTERFVSISTDKAVCPRNMLGASKQLGELVVGVAAQAPPVGLPVFSSVRFGNVLGSQGSVVPTFSWQIDRGGPVTVTDPGMTRFFMSIEEAVALVIQASAYARGGEVFILDMGEPVSVDDLARRMIRLKGLRVGTDIEIVYSGVRPGEKLAEKLWCEAHEVPLATPHPSITRVLNSDHLDGDSLAAGIAQMELALLGGREQELCARMFRLALASCAGCADDPLATDGAGCPSLATAVRYEMAGEMVPGRASAEAVVGA